MSLKIKTAYYKESENNIVFFEEIQDTDKQILMYQEIETCIRENAISDLKVQITKSIFDHDTVKIVIEFTQKI